MVLHLVKGEILGNVEISLVAVDEFPPFSGGKRHYLLSEVPYKPPSFKAEWTSLAHGSLEPKTVERGQ